MPESVRSILVRAKARIGTPERWRKGTYNIHGDGLCCVNGAIAQVLGGEFDFEVEHAFQDANGIARGRTEAWNDAPGRTHAEVMEAFDRAISSLPEDV